METEQYIFANELDRELKFNFSRSGGPGGQNVNKVNTKAELRFDIRNSLLLSEDLKMMLLDKLQNQISQEGFLIIIAQSTRSQLQNKEEAIVKFYELINKALKPKKKRKPKSIPKAAKEKRLKEKKEVSEKKDRRSNWD